MGWGRSSGPARSLRRRRWRAGRRAGAGTSVGKQGGELVGGGGGAGFVEVDELVGFEAEDLAEVGAVAPGTDEVADAGEGVAAVLEAADQLEAGEVRAPVDADAAAAFGGGEQADGLVLADRAHREAGAGGELVDGQLDSVAGGAVVAGASMARQ